MDDEQMNFERTVEKWDRIEAEQRERMNKPHPNVIFRDEKIELRSLKFNVKQVRLPFGKSQTNQ